MSTFVTSDTHFFHKNVIKYCSRPYESVEEMNRALIHNWNEIVRPSDTVYHLGDFTFGPKLNTPEMVKKLNGHKIIIKGNHDRKVEYLRESGFEVYHRLEAMIEGVQVVMQHYPPKWERWGQPPHFEGLFLHGHVHDLWRRVGNIVNAGVDVWDMKPVTITQLLNCPQDPNPPTGHGRCKQNRWVPIHLACEECSECQGFFVPQDHAEAPEAL